MNSLFYQFIQLNEKHFMKIEIRKIFADLAIVLFLCSALTYSNTSLSFGSGHNEHAEVEPEKGPHHGRLLIDGDFSIELSIFETGVPPEFRVWVTQKGQPVDPADVSLTATLTRLGGVNDNIQFKPHDDFLRGDTVIYEPHSFIVSVSAEYQGKSHRWQYDNFEGRTKISDEVADVLDITTSIAGPAVLKETVSVYGKLTLHPEYVRKISARFDGTIKQVDVGLGEHVTKGQTLAIIESNESLKAYSLTAPMSGVITQRNANPGEQTNNRTLLSIANSSVLMGELSIFPNDRHKIKLGAPVQLFVKGYEQPVNAVIKQIDSTLQTNQSIIVRAEIKNEQSENKTMPLVAGSFVQAEIEVAEHHVELAVKRAGLQAFRDFTVVYEKIGDEYEVRMLELGRVAGEWVEILGGLKTGSKYVSKNSYIIKADIEKSGAAHDH